MPEVQSELAKFVYSLNTAFEASGAHWKIIPDIPTVVKASNNDDFTIADTNSAVNFEQFDGTVHLYVLKDSQGNPLKQFDYYDKDGKTQSLIADGVKNTINVLDFKNTTEKAFHSWTVAFNSTELNITSDVVNGILKKENGTFYIKAVLANQQLGVGESLRKKIIFVSDLVGGKVAIARDFLIATPQPVASEPSLTTKEVVPDSGYKKALELTLSGFSWQVSGKTPGWAKNPVRADCFLADGTKDAKRDLSGGMHDAGDCIKVALAAFSNCSQLSFASLFNKEKLVKTGQYAALVNIIRHYCDWGKKCQEMDTQGNTIRVWHWVSDNRVDHACMLAPEQQESKYYAPKGIFRQSFAIGDGHEPVGEEPPSLMAACFALTSLLLKDEDKSYADDLLKRARSLYKFAQQHRGKYTPHTVYTSSSYGDDITFAAIALYLATQESGYLSDAEKYFDSHISYPGWTWLVDNHSSVATFLLAYCTKKPKYLDMCKSWINSWVKGINGVRKHNNSPLRSNSDWGSIPQFASAFSLALFADRSLGLKNPEVTAIARQGMNYVLGDNPNKFSWLAGYGSNYPKNLHHRSLMNNKSAIGTGLWAAGEKADGFYQDKDTDWITNECGCYQSAVFMLLADLL